MYEKVAACDPKHGIQQSAVPSSQNLPAGVMDHEKHAQRAKRDRLDAKEASLIWIHRSALF
jgi:hypothetical protein